MEGRKRERKEGRKTGRKGREGKGRKRERQKKYQGIQRKAFFQQMILEDFAKELLLRIL